MDRHKDTDTETDTHSHTNARSHTHTHKTNVCVTEPVCGVDTKSAQALNGSRENAHGLGSDRVLGSVRIQSVWLAVLKLACDCHKISMRLSQSKPDFLSCRYFKGWEARTGTGTGLISKINFCKAIRGKVVRYFLQQACMHVHSNTSYILHFLSYCSATV